jgi:urate oxidase
MSRGRVVSERPLIILKIYVKYAYISMDASMDSTQWDAAWHPITDEGETILWKYLDSIKNHIKINTIYGAGRYTNVTVRKEIIDEVVKKFLSVYRQNHRTITHIDILHAGVTGGLLR